MKERILNYLRNIPPGYVATYGDIALYLGNINLSRFVGNVLHNNPDGDYYPCYKVVNRNGNLSPNYAFGGIDEQKRRLEQESIKVVSYKVDLKKYRYTYKIC